MNRSIFKILLQKLLLKFIKPSYTLKKWFNTGKNESRKHRVKSPRRKNVKSP